MELHLSFCPEKPSEISDVYRSYIQALVYKLLAEHNPEYASLLHNCGYKVNERIYLKNFVFSGIHDMNGHHPRKSRMNHNKNAYELFPDTHYRVIFRSSKLEFIQTFLFGIFQKQIKEKGRFYLGHCKCQIIDVELKELPEIIKKQHTYIPFHSGIVAIKKHAHHARIQDQYLTLTHQKMLEQAVKNNLLIKAKQENIDIQDDQVSLTFKTIHHERERKQATPRIPIEHNGKQFPLFATRAPIILHADPTIHKLALSAGLGEKGSEGCGFINLID